MRSARLPVLLLLVLAVPAACTDGSSVVDAVTPEQAITLSANVEVDAADVPVEQLVQVEAQHGSIGEATLTGPDGEVVEGEGSEQGWRATQRLEPATEYRLEVTGVGEDGEPGTLERSFTTRALTLDEQTYPSVAPLEGETVGVGMPVIVTFDLPVEDKALYERNMHVRTEEDVRGSWTWFSDNEAHYRPHKYWPAGTEVTVDLQLNSLPAGGGIYGQQDQNVPFTVGSKVVSTVDVADHTLRVNIDGEDVRTIPVSTGKAGHETRAGTKVIMEKFSSVDMDAATTGVDSEDPEYYDISDVRWAMRVTNSGEFLHAAPWSVASQGRENVSHGCTGMSTDDAAWLFERSKRGDVVRYVNSDRPLEDRNGWTDWNVPWSDWVDGSALT